MRYVDSRIRSLLGAVCLALLTVVWLGGCNTGASAPADGGGGSRPPGNADGTNDEDGGAQAGEDQVLVRFINATDVAVDTEFYATNLPLDDPRTDLFVPQYHYTVDIGEFGSGKLRAGTDDEIPFPCSESTVLGTAGAEYLDPELGTFLATGQARVVEVGVNFDCGNTIIFTFRGEDGEYSTEPPLIDFTD